MDITATESAINWHPSASGPVLRFRSQVIQIIRNFFAQAGVLEVETPLLSPFTATDPVIASLSVEFESSRWYLQTSPEFAMKRLLAGGSGAIYQICKAFRQDESARLHNPEFTMMEWYRPGFDHHQLMDEVNYSSNDGENILCLRKYLK